MSSDGRWTGGAANREWQRGSRPAEPPLDPKWLAAQVFAYRADCYAARGTLDPAYHPTAAGAVKLIFHRGPGQAEQIRAAYLKPQVEVEV